MHDSASTDSYSTGILRHDLPSEQRRLELLEALLDGRSKSFLADRGIQPTWRCLELGAGAGSVARWLAEQCPDGQVVAVDIDTRYLDPGWAPNLEVRQMDIRSEGFPRASFDLIHTRALLMHLPERETILARAREWLAPGGWLVTEDPTTFPIESSPHPAWQRVVLAFGRLLNAQGADVSWPRQRVPAALADAGLVDLGMAITPVLVGDGGAGDRFWRAMLDQVGPRIVNAGLLTANELAAGRALFDDPSFVDTADAFLAGWGRRPR